VLALAIARVISGSGEYAPDAAEKITGVPAKRIERIAKAFADSKPGVAIVGGAPLAHTNGLATALAVNSLNALVGSIGQAGGVHFTPASTKYEARNLKVDDITAAKVLLVDGANPVHGMPKAMNVREAIGKVPFIASFGSFIDDTSAYADLLLPDHSFLESWIDSQPESGSIDAVVNAAGPVMKPLHDTRATPDVLIEIAGKLKKPVALPWKTFDEMLKASLGDA